MERVRLRWRAVALLGVLGVAPGVRASSADSWGMWQRDAAHTGFVSEAFKYANVRYSWSQRAQPWLITGLAASSTAVFTTLDPREQQLDAQQTLAAQDLGDGHRLWTVTFPLGTRVGSPAYADAMVFLTEHHYTGYSEDAYYQDAFDATSGAPIFHTQIYPPTAYVAPTVANGHVYFVEALSSSVEGEFASVSAPSGDPDWMSNTPLPNGQMPTYVDGQLFGFSTTLNILDAASGDFLGSITDPNNTSDISGGIAPTILGTTAYATHGNRVVAIDLMQQQVVWWADWYAQGQISTDGQYLFYLSAGALAIRDAASGLLQWGWEAPQPGIGSYDALSDNMVITKSHVILSDGSNIYFVNRATQMSDGGFAVGGLLAFAGNKLIVADGTGIVTTFAVPSDVVFLDSFE